jgi:hypothetical protein
MRRFVLLYRAREGSTALIEAINNRPNVNVPIVEHLDAHWMERHCPDADALDCMRRILETGELSHGPTINLGALREAWSPPEDIDGIGFKWRPYGSPKRVMRAMKDYDVAVIFLHRALLDVSASFYLSRRQGRNSVGGGHFQFSFRKLSEEEQARVRARLDSLEVGLNPIRFYGAMLRRLYQDARTLRYLRQAHLAGLPTAILDYAVLARDIDDAVDTVLQTAGIPVRRDDVDARELTFRKASSRPATERIRHFWLIRWNPLTWLLVALDNALVSYGRSLGRRRRPAPGQEAGAARHDMPAARAGRSG